MLQQEIGVHQSGMDKSNNPVCPRVRGYGTLRLAKLGEDEGDWLQKQIPGANFRDSGLSQRESFILSSACY